MAAARDQAARAIRPDAETAEGDAARDTSGHAPGSRSLYCSQAGIVIVGDALFYRSIGRTDFHHASHAGLIRNIRQNLLSLPDETKVYSGHGPVTTIGAERRSNPFLQADADE